MSEVMLDAEKTYRCLRCGKNFAGKDGQRGADEKGERRTFRRPSCPHCGAPWYALFPVNESTTTPKEEQTNAGNR